MVKSRSSQWYQELRLQSSFDGPVNFIFGANYLKYKVDEDYYVFNNLFTASARTIFGGGQAGNPVKDCYNYVPISAFDTCVYTDQNTINRIDGDGHNYFRSRNLNKTESKAVRSEEHTSELQSLMRISYAVFCLKKKKNNTNKQHQNNYQQY